MEMVVAAIGRKPLGAELMVAGDFDGSGDGGGGGYGAAFHAAKEAVE